MKIYNKSKIIPTCVKESLERKEKAVKAKQETLPQQLNSLQNRANIGNEQNIYPGNFNQESNFPYLQNVNSTSNRENVKTLKLLNFGKDGELSIFLSYIYQLSVLPQQNTQLRQTLENILPKQLEIYKELSNTVALFGGNPTLTNGRGNVWTGRNIVSTTNQQSILQRNILNLEKSIKNFNLASSQTNNQFLINLYNSIIIEKQNQLTALQNLLFL